MDKVMKMEGTLFELSVPIPSLKYRLIYAHSERQSKMITINYIRGDIVRYSSLLSLGARHYGVVPLKSALTFSHPPPLNRVH